MYVNMQEREGDPRIYLVSCFFFACIVSGGVLLGLYMFLPDRFSASFYAVGGLVLVAIPWMFWFVAYIYRCFKPLMGGGDMQSHERTNMKKQNHVASTPMLSPKKATNPRPDQATTPKSAKATSPKATSSAGSAEDSPARHSSTERRVHFGEVVVMGNEVNNKKVNNVDKNGHVVTIDESPGESDRLIAT